MCDSAYLKELNIKKCAFSPAAPVSGKLAD